MSLVRHNFSGEIEKALNDFAHRVMEYQINYVQWSAKLSEDKIGLIGFAMLFSRLAKTDGKLACCVFSYINRRGGHVSIGEIRTGERRDIRSPLQVLEETVRFKK